MAKLSREKHQEILDYFKEFPQAGTCEGCAQALGISKGTVSKYRRLELEEPPVELAIDDLQRLVKEFLTRKVVAASLEVIAHHVGCTLKQASQAINGLLAAGISISQRPDYCWQILKEPAPGGSSVLNVEARDDGWTVLGFTGDNHLGSRHCRLDVLHRLYDIFEAEGVRHVFNTGNWIEGESRFNRHDIEVFGLDRQVAHFIEAYPERTGITTHYVAGDDHEGWYQQRESLEIGRHVQTTAAAGGREDLRYLGYLEADVALRTGKAATAMKIMHGGGGTSYALSYKPQKIVESLQGGEKPSVLAIGHYHKFDYCYPRNVHAFMVGCTQDQSIFMRKRSIEAHVGGVLVWLQQDPKDGHITRFRCEFLPFYDRGYYETRY